jgi:hypothetical protein
VTPGVRRFVPEPLSGQLFSNDGGVISPTIAGSFGVRERQRTAAAALDHDVLWTPLVDPAKLHLLDVIAPLATFDDCNHSTFPSPPDRSDHSCLSHWLRGSMIAREHRIVMNKLDHLSLVQTDYEHQSRTSRVVIGHGMLTLMEDPHRGLS